jgi:pyruvate kinase
VMRELALSYGVFANYQEGGKSMDNFIHVGLKNLTAAHDLTGNELVVVLAGNFTDGTGFSFIEVGSVSYLRDRVSIHD